MDTETDKIGLVSNFVRWTIVVSAFIIALTVAISWTLWITLYRGTIDDALVFFGNKTIAQGYGINFDFLILSIISLVVVLLTFLFALPLVFYRKKTGFMVFVSLFNFILGAIILVSAILFIMTSYSFYGDFYQIFGLNKTLIVFLPWVIVIFVDLFLIFSSLWSLISSANGVNFVPDGEEEAKDIQKEVNDLPTEETVIHPTEQIIVPTQTEESPQPKTNEEIIINPVESVPAERKEKHSTMPPVEESTKVISTSQLGAFAIYRENEHGAYVLLKDYSLGTEEPVKELEHKEHHEHRAKEQHKENHKEHHEHRAKEHVKKVDKKVKYEGILTPKVEEITPIIANLDLPPLVPKKEKVKPINNWSKEQIEEVWNKAQIINDVNPKLYRKDYAGAWMFHDAFTNTLEEVNVRSYAWTIVNHRPLAEEGDNEIENLDPMNVTNAITKGKDYPKWKTKISSSGNENVLKEQTWKARL